VRAVPLVLKEVLAAFQQLVAQAAVTAVKIQQAVHFRMAAVVDQAVVHRVEMSRAVQARQIKEKTAEMDLVRLNIKWAQVAAEQVQTATMLAQIQEQAERAEMD
jgi:hypothetical protein